MGDLNEKEMVNHPQHYKSGDYECSEVMKAVFGIEAWNIFCQMNTFKYLFRHKKKNGAEDLRKAQWYMANFIPERKIGNADRIKQVNEKCLEVIYKGENGEETNIIICKEKMWYHGRTLYLLNDGDVKAMSLDFKDSQCASHAFTAIRKAKNSSNNSVNISYDEHKKDSENNEEKEG